MFRLINVKSFDFLMLLLLICVTSNDCQPQRFAGNNVQGSSNSNANVNDSPPQPLPPSSGEDGSSEGGNDDDTVGGDNGPTPLQGPPRPPTINWGKCPQLEPKEAEKKQKADIIRTCLKSIPLPENITQESVEKHRTSVAKCALNAENWFSEDGNYRYDKAETEVKNKKLDSTIEPQIINQHKDCRKEAEEQFPSGIAQIQLYQACMDYHISIICGIQIVGSGFPQ